MFGMNKLFGADEIKIMPTEAERVLANQKVAMLGHPGAKPEDFLNANIAPPKPTRPGDTPPRAFVGKTLDQLKKTQESYVAERDLLAKDIQKLTEEHSQVIRSLAAINAAIASLEAPEVQVDTQKLEAELANVGTV